MAIRQILPVTGIFINRCFCLLVACRIGPFHLGSGPNPVVGCRQSRRRDSPLPQPGHQPPIPGNPTRRIYPALTLVLTFNPRADFSVLLEGHLAFSLVSVLVFILDLSFVLLFRFGQRLLAFTPYNSRTGQTLRIEIDALSYVWYKDILMAPASEGRTAAMAFH